MKKVFILLILSILLAFSSTNYAGGNNLQPRKLVYNPLLAGFILGYGETDYSAIIADDSATKPSTITGTDDNGFLGGLFLGFQFSPFFIGEFSWVKYPNARLIMAQPNFYGVSSFWTSTNAYSVVLQFLVSVYHTKLKAYADAGLVFITRSDILAHISHVGPTFGIGLMYNMTQSWFSQLGFVYAAGFGKTIDTPLFKYVPFLLSAQLRVGYRFPF